MEKKIKVFYLANWYNSIYNDIFNNLDSEIDITMILSEQFPNFSDNKYKVKILPTHDLGKFIYSKKAIKKNYLLIHTKELRKFIEKEKPDVVMANMLCLPSTYQISKICKKLKIKFILQTEIKKLPNLFLEKFLFKAYSIFFVRKILQNSTFFIPWVDTSKTFLSKYYSVSDNKMEVLPPGINSDMFYPSKNKKYLKNETLNILMIARFMPFKRHQDLVNAAIILKNKKIKFKVTLLDEGPTRNEIKKLVKNNNLDEEFIFLGRVAWEKVRKIILKHDIFVLTSYYEPIGLVVPESMACGLPVIISDTCGAKTYVREGKNGLFYKTGNPDDLAKKIIELNNQKKLEKFGKMSSEIIKTNYTIKIIAEKYSEIIKKVNKEN